jgi:hypothetical protein
LGQRFNGIDYDFRPTTYWPVADEGIAELLKLVKDANQRRMLHEYFVEGRMDEVDAQLLAEALNDDVRRSLGRPPLDGAEHLPDYRIMEVEIARIALASTPIDVISVRARRRSQGSRIRYRIVDMYRTEFTWSPKSSSILLTLGQLADLIDSAQPVTDFAGEGGLGLCYNNKALETGTGAEGLRHFTTVSSEFYQQLGAHYDKLHELWVSQQR